VDLVSTHARTVFEGYDSQAEATPRTSATTETARSRVGVDPSALVAVLNELEGLGLASRQRDPADRRRHIVTMTAAGANTLRVVESVLDKTDDDLFAALSPAERGQLERLLTKIADPGPCGEPY
jgi:DNA-binding MarR family transcriptional regulator